MRARNYYHWKTKSLKDWNVFKDLRNEVTGRRFLATKDGEDSVVCPLQRMYLRSQVHKRVLKAAEGS